MKNYVDFIQLLVAEVNDLLDPYLSIINIKITLNMVLYK